LNSGDVVEERNQVMNEVGERHPATNLLNRQGSILTVTALRTGRKPNNYTDNKSAK
jgi:hypothetical protein